MNQFIQGNTYYHYAYPREEFNRNFQLMCGLGINYVRTAEIWPGWSVIERQEGQYDFEELDEFVRLAGENGLKICMGIGINDTPFWLYYKYPDLKMRDTDGKASKRRVQSACFDHMEYRTHMEAFIAEIVTHYDRNPAVCSFQIGNEMRYNVPVCDCDSTRKRFREWLKARYHDNLEDLNAQWGVYYNSFEEIYPYNSGEGAPTKGITPHYLMSRAYQNWSIEELVESSVKIVKEYSPKPVFHNSYGTPNMMGSHYRIAKPCDLAVIDIYSSTYQEPGYYQNLILDYSRTIAGIQNKDLWIGETPAGQYGTYSRIPVDYKMMELCVMDLISAGAKAIFYFRHKAPKYEQPHKFTGSQTFFRVDESELVYSEIPKKVERLMSRYENRILSAVPGKASVLLYYPTENIWLGKEAGYEKESILAIHGTKAILSSAGYMADVMDEEMMLNQNLNAYQVIVIPMTYLISRKLGNRLGEFVKNGGTLICEGRPAYVDELGWLYEIQPGAGLDRVFGAREDLYFNTPADFPVKIKAGKNGLSGYGTYLKQTYRLEGGEALMEDEEGNVCGVSHDFGQGRAYLIGTVPGLFFSMGAGKYDKMPDPEKEIEASERRSAYISLYQELIRGAGVNPAVEISKNSNNLSIRTLENETEEVVFVSNFSRNISVELKLDGKWEELTEEGERECGDLKEVGPLHSLIISRRKTDERS